MTISQAGSEYRRNLPAGWRWARLGEVCRVVSGATPNTSIQEYWNGEIPWVTPTDLGKVGGPQLHQTQRCISRKGLASCSAQIVPVGTVLMSSRAPIGHLAIAEVPCCTNQGCKNFVAGEDVDGWYLYYALKQAVPTLRELGSGATFSEVSKSMVENFSIPLPPLREQKRIAAILIEQMEAVERARAAAEAQLEAVKALPVAYLREVFGSSGYDSVPSIPLGWHWVKLGQLLAAPLKTGISKPFDPVGSNRCLTLTAVRNRVIDMSANKTVAVTDQDAEGNWVRPGAYYVVRGNGNLALVGRAARAPKNIDGPVLYPDLLIEVMLDESSTLPEFFGFAWESLPTRKDVESRTRTSAGIFKINQGNLQQVRILLPPLPEQKRIAALLSEKITFADRARHAADAQFEAINKLPLALLQRSLRGEL